MDKLFLKLLCALDGGGPVNYVLQQQMEKVYLQSLLLFHLCLASPTSSDGRTTIAATFPICVQY